MEDYLEKGLLNGSIKLCPFCKTPTELISGCNFVTCFCGPKSEFCFLCNLPKYKPIPNTTDFCNDSSHNSH